MDTRLNFDTIHLVEWLRVDDGRTGWEVFNEIEPIGLVSRPPVSVKYSRLSSRADMIALLRAVAADVQRHRTAPILHIETHGDSNGIGISDHDGLLWSDFMRELIPINEAMKVNLFVILAACEGVWGIQMLQPADRAAFRALIGPNHPVSASDLSKGVLTFYRTMFREASAVTAYRAMNDVVDPNKKTFGIVTAEHSFRMVLRGYLNRPQSDADFAAREQNVVDQFNERFFRDHGRYPSAEETDRFRTEWRVRVTDDRARFGEIRERFFFIDRFPENDARFDAVTFEECSRPDF